VRVGTVGSRSAASWNRSELAIAIALIAGACGASGAQSPDSEDGSSAPRECVAGKAEACRTAGTEAEDPNAGLQYYERGCTLGDKPSCQAAADGWRRAGDEAKALDFEKRAR
jgi:hypothetical protein